MIASIALTLLGFAFLVLIIGAAFHHPKGECDDYDCPCHLEFASDDFDDLTPMCEEECDAKGAFGECSKCGWVDHLAQSKSEPKEVK